MLVARAWIAPASRPTVFKWYMWYLTTIKKQHSLVFSDSSWWELPLCMARVM